MDALCKQVMTPNWEGALSFFKRAAELFSQTYDGKDEVRPLVLLS